MTDAALDEWLRANGLRDALHEEVYVSDVDDDPMGLGTSGIFDRADLFEVNALAKVMDDDEDAVETVETALACGIDDHTSVGELAGLILNADDFAICELPKYGALSTPEERLGYLMAEESGLVEKLEALNISWYFDFESYGRDIVINDGASLGDDACVFDTPGGVTLDAQELRELSAGWDERHSEAAA